MPSLESLHQHFNDKPFILLAIDVEEKKEIVQKFVRSRRLSFKFLLDKDGYVSARYGIRSHPTKFLIDTEGNLIGIARGYNKWDTDNMKSLIRLLISSKE